MEREEEPDIDFEAGARRLTLDEGKKRSKSKSKAKKSGKGLAALKAASEPAAASTSLHDTAADDQAQYEARLAAHKSARSKPKDYKPADLFEAGDVLQHHTFGLGFVLAPRGTNKIEVLFSQGRKLLVMGMVSKPRS